MRSRARFSFCAVAMLPVLAWSLGDFWRWGADSFHPDGWNAALARAARGAGVALMVAFGAAGPATATTIAYGFSFAGPGVVADGTLDIDAALDPLALYAGGHDILGIDGTLDGAAILGPLGAAGPAILSPDGFFIADNIFYPSGSASAAGAFFDVDGLLFQTTADDFNLYFDGTTTIDYADQGLGTAVAFSASAQTAVPEPSTVLLLGGATLIGLLLIRRKRAGAAAPR